MRNKKRNVAKKANIFKKFLMKTIHKYKKCFSYFSLMFLLVF